jgi:hypothetical protein
MQIVKVPDGSNLPGKAQNHVALRINSQVNLAGFLGTDGPLPLPASPDHAVRKHTYPVRDLPDKAQIHVALRQQMLFTLLVS